MEPSYTSVNICEDDHFDRNDDNEMEDGEIRGVSGVDAFHDDDDDSDDDALADGMFHAQQQSKSQTKAKRRTRTALGWGDCSLLPVACFVLGMFIGGPLAVMLSTKYVAMTTNTTTTTPQAPTVPSCDCNDNHNHKQQGVSSSAGSHSVSHSFLKTSKGQDTLRDLLELLASSGPRVVLDRVSELMEQDSQIAASCHPLTHQIGRNALQMFGFVDAFDGLPGTDDDKLLHTCNAAYMHGIIEHYLLNSTQLLQDAAFVDRSICKILNDGVEHGIITTLPWECRHGIGHGILQHLQEQADFDTLKQSLQACASSCAYVTGASAQYCMKYANQCQNGVWMDYFTTSVKLTAPMVDPSMTQICTSVPGNMDPNDCTFYAPTAFLLHNPQQYTAAIDWCLDGFGLSRQQVEAAYNGVTNINDDKLVTHAEKVNQKKMVALLQECIGGVGGQVAKENLNDLLPVQETCLNAPSSIIQTYCFERGLNYQSLSSGKIKFDKSVCDTVTNPEFRTACLDHAN